MDFSVQISLYVWISWSNTKVWWNFHANKLIGNILIEKKTLKRSILIFPAVLAESPQFPLCKNEKNKRGTGEDASLKATITVDAHGISGSVTFF